MTSSAKDELNWILLSDVHIYYRFKSTQSGQVQLSLCPIISAEFITYWYTQGMFKQGHGHKLEDEVPACTG